MAINIDGSNLPTFPLAKKARTPNKMYARVANNQTRSDGKPPDGYGQNGFTGASSVQPAGRAAANLSDLDTAPPGGDAVLDRLIDGGSGKVASDQTRTIDATPLKTAFGMRKRGGDGVVPAKTGAK